jgi:hypothetical protein
MKGSGLGSELTKGGIPATINPRYVGSVAKSPYYLGAFWGLLPPSPTKPPCRSSHLRLLTHYTAPSHALTDFSDAFRRARKYRVVIAIVMVIIMIFHAEPLCGFFAPYIDAAVL